MLDYISQTALLMRFIVNDPHHLFVELAIDYFVHYVLELPFEFKQV